jgi:hypothetical protein
MEALHAPAGSEAYSLVVPVTGAATLQADSYLGVLRGLETFSQLVQPHIPVGAGALPPSPTSSLPIVSRLVSPLPHPGCFGPPPPFALHV